MPAANTPDPRVAQADAFQQVAALVATRSQAASHAATQADRAQAAAAHIQASNACQAAGLLGLANALNAIAAVLQNPDAVPVD